MEFTPRIQQILRILLDADEPIAKQQIADEIGVSKRTVQREFEYLELCIRKYNLRLENHKGKGVSLKGSPEDLERLRDSLSEDMYPDSADIEGRRRRLLFELLRDRTPRKLFYYAQMLGVSEATTGSDMDALCPWLEESRLGIVRRPGYGVILEGDERDYREAMRRFIGETAGHSDAYFLIREIKRIISQYRKMEISETVRFRELLQFMAMQVTESLHAAAALRDGIEERERLNTQIFPDLGVALLHCRSGAVREPVIISCTPRGPGNYIDPYFKGIRAAILMVMPKDDNRILHAEVLGSISGALVTNEYFLKMIKYGSEQETRAELARELKCFFFDYLDRV